MPIFTGVVAIVDDDPFMLRALERTLVAYAYRVKAFASAEEYLEQVDAGQVVCAVLDVHLGSGISGLDLGEKIRSAGHAMPIVFMSGTEDPTIRARAARIGCLDFLEKPFPTSRLVEVIMGLDSNRS